MSVFTTVSREQLGAWLKHYSLGALEDFQGIASGIENTNYFVTTSHGRYVLTLFEKLQREQLPFLIDLLAHLAAHGIPCPRPVANLDNQFIGILNGKPACLASRLEGASLDEPQAEHCFQLGELLADMHLAARSYPARMSNPRGLAWWQATASELLPRLPAEDRAMLDAEIRYQSLQDYDRLPQGVIHADLFRDNALFQDGRLSGVVDFYSACNGAWAYDLAIAVNDWCVQPDATLDSVRLSALLQGYRQTRPLSTEESAAWPLLLRAAALRFWLSRLYDAHFPRVGELTYAKDPEHFRRILRQHIAHPAQLV